jgi:anti-sigma B factor antagonist
MEMDVKQKDGVLVVKPLNNSIDTTVTREFKGKLTDLINQGNKLLILDLSQVDFIDSNGLGTLISILKLLTNNQGSIVICDIRDSVIKLFNLTRLNLVFQMCRDEEESLNLLKAKFKQA